MDDPVPDESRRPRADYRVVTPDYFAAMKIPFNTGRGFGTGNRPDTMPVTIVSKSMAARLWPNEDPSANVSGRRGRSRG